MKLSILPFLIFSTVAQAQYDTTFNYKWIATSVVTYSSSGVYKAHKWDTLDFAGATRPINVKGETLYFSAPVSDTLTVSSNSGDWNKDTVLSYGYKGGVTGFYYKGPLNSNGSVYDYFYLSYPDKRLPNGDIQVKNIQLIIVKRAPNYSN